MAQAPSFRPDELPAVTDPPSRNAAASFDSVSIVVSPRGCSSLSTTISVLPFLTVTLTISRSKKPRSCAALQRRWLR